MSHEFRLHVPELGPDLRSAAGRPGCAPAAQSARGPQIGVRGRGHPSPVQADRRPVVASDQSSPPTSAAEALEHLGSLSLRKVSMEYLLQTVADLAKSVMPGS